MTGEPRRKNLRYGWLVLLCWLGVPPVAALDLADYPRLREVVQELVSRHGFSESELAALVSQARWRPEVLEALSKPAERLPWYRYRPIFVTPERAAEGAAFAREHQALLARADAEYGVPAEILVAIIGVETRYGRYRGRHLVFDSLATIAASDHRRNDFFRDELVQFLLLSREEGFAPEKLKGSYAGAIGIPQFISSSYRRYAVDFDGDRQRDLVENPADAIGSVANYLAEHGWRRGEPLLDSVVRGDAPDPDAPQSLKPSVTRAEWEARGVRWPASSAAAADEPVAVLGFDSGTGTHWLATYGNFYAVTRYNHSAHYALAVIQLAQAIRQQLDRP